VGNLGTIPAGKSLTALEDLRLSLQTRSTTGGEITAVTLYLATGGRLDLSTLDVGAQSPQTVVTLQSGRLLMDRSGGSRETWVRAGSQGVSFAAPGIATLGVSVDGGAVVVDCLVGRCAMDVGSEEVEFDAPVEIAVVGSTAASPQSVPTGAIRAWNALCGGCLPSP
jgi:hypothetical protein